MNDARERMLDSPIYSDATERLIGKLLVPENLTLIAHKECLADMITKFFNEHQKFVNQTGILNSNTMWYTAGKSDFVVGMVHAIVVQKLLKCNIFKSFYRVSKLKSSR